MKLYRFPFFPATVFAFFLLTGGAQSLAAVSSRPEVQRNFQRLLETRSCPSCDLAGADLTRANLKEVDLSGANLAGAKLTLADLSGANLKNANLQGANLGGADLAYADLEEANLTGAILEGAFLSSAKMKGTVVTKSTHEVEIKAGIGEKVFVPDESQSKRKPYTQDSPLEVAPQKMQTDFPIAPAPVPTPAAEKKSQPAQAPASTPAPQTDQVQSKKLVPMSEAVVPEGAEAGQKPASAAEKISPDSPPAKDDRSSLNTKGALPPMEEEMPPVAVQANDMPGVQNGASSSLAPEGAAEQTPAAVENESQLEASVSAQEEQAPNVLTPEPGATVSSSGTDTVTADTSVTEEQVAVAQQAAPVEQPAAENSALQQEMPAAGKGETVAEVRQEIVNSAPAAEVPAVTELDAGKMGLLKQLFDKKRCVGCDLSRVDLSGRNMGGFDLERSKLGGSNLRGVDLAEANLKGSDFSNTQMQEADLRKADLYLADFSGADLTGARFQEALVDSTNFTGAIGVNLEGAIVSK